MMLEKGSIICLDEYKNNNAQENGLIPPKTSHIQKDIHSKLNSRKLKKPIANESDFYRSVARITELQALIDIEEQRIAKYFQKCRDK